MDYMHELLHLVHYLLQRADEEKCYDDRNYQYLVFVTND